MFFYYMDTENNTQEFKDLMSKFKIKFNKKRINVFSNKFIFIKIIGNLEYFLKILTVETLSFNLYNASDIFFYNYNKETKLVNIPLHHIKMIIMKQKIDDTQSQT